MTVSSNPILLNTTQQIPVIMHPTTFGIDGQMHSSIKIPIMMIISPQFLIFAILFCCIQYDIKGMPNHSFIAVA